MRTLHTLIRILRQTRAHDAVERRRHQRHRRRHRGRVFFQDGAEQACLALAGKRPPAGEHLVEHAAKRPDVGARVGLLALHHLRRHVLKRAEDGALRRQRSRPGGRGGDGEGAAAVDRAGHDLRQTEIEQLHTRGGDHDVAGLQVAMQDALAVRGVEGAGDLHRPGQRLRDGHGSLGNSIGECFTLEMLHHEEAGAALLAHVEQGADVGVAQLRDGARLPLEPLAELRRRGDERRQYLDRHGAVEARVARLEHFAHAAGAEFGQDFVGSELGADHDAGPGRATGARLKARIDSRTPRRRRAHRGGNSNSSSTGSEPFRRARLQNYWNVGARATRTLFGS